MRTIELTRSVSRFVAARALSGKAPGLLTGPLATLRLADRQAPTLRPEWGLLRTRLSGICGSDLNTISGGSSFYFSALVSMPFTPGHEVVADLTEDLGDLPAGTRVVIDPTLSCAPRGIDPMCGPCASGEPGRCERVTVGGLEAGIQTGYCHGASGGWAEMLTAHRSQLHPIPDWMSDEAAVLIEPLACAIRSVRRAEVGRDATVLVVGAGTVGLLTLVALRAFTSAARIIVAAKHPHQVELAKTFGATKVVSPSEALGAVRRSTLAFRLEPERSAPFLLGGADVSFECAGSGSALDLALRATKAGGTVVMTGMPHGADLTPAWFRELSVVGSYTGSGAFSDAIELSREHELGKLVSASYPLTRWRDAVDHALDAGSLGAVKIAFDPRLDG